MKRSALMMAAALSLSPFVAKADDDGSGRHLRYVAVAGVDGEPTRVTIDLDIAMVERGRVARVEIEEHRDGEAFAQQSVAIDRDGTVSDADEGLTFEEETLLDLLSLQFVNMRGVDPGDHWDRVGDLRVGSHRTHFVVRDHEGPMVTLDIARTMEFPDGSRGRWRADVAYDASAVVPRSVNLAGSIVDRGDQQPLQFSARLVRDSFQADP